MRFWRRRGYRVECEKCGRKVKPSKAVTITDSGYDATEFGAGGWSITATYCKADAPKGAAA